MTVLDDILAQMTTKSPAEPAGLLIERFDHWHNPADAMVLPTRTGCSAGETD
ncbi:hypothetical protein KIPE111705_36020 [Kibdelosporangium persicum]|uniref:hypothetical protein n=1 Tax=Kibdelosporangium persicum TaxID=2698649 RepID=UPI001565F61E|nr:hypothetical protein [Kibdelosporangium persicum]